MRQFLLAVSLLAFCFARIVPPAGPRELLHVIWLITAIALGALISKRDDAVPTEVPARNASGFQRAILALIVCGAAFIRFFELDFGFPFFYHPDEGIKAKIIQKMAATGSLNPQYFLHPTLLLYLGRAWYGLLAFFPLPLEGLEHAVLSGRIVSAIAGSVSVLLVWGIGRELLGVRASLFAAYLVAFSPLHVTCSRYLKEDVLCVMFVLAVVYCCLKCIRTGRLHWLYGAGLLAGAATGSKYTGLLSAAFILLTPYLAGPAAGREQGEHKESKFARALRGDTRLWKHAAGSLLAVPVGFVICCPYAALSVPTFFKHFLVERNHMLGGHRGIAIDAWSQYWMYHFSRSIVPAITGLPAALAVLGLGYLSVKRSRVYLIPLIGVLLFYIPAEWVKAKPLPQPDRYILGCVPFLALSFAAFCEKLPELLGRRTAALIIFAALVLPGARTVSLAREMQEDTRERMTAWMVAHLPPESKILIEATYSPRLQGTVFERKLFRATRRREALRISRLEKSGYDFLLVNSFSYGRYFTEPGADGLLKKRFERIFNTLPLIKEVRSPAGSYGFHNPTVRLYSLRPQEYMNKE